MQQLILIYNSQKAAKDPMAIGKRGRAIRTVMGVPVALADPRPRPAPNR